MEQKISLDMPIEELDFSTRSYNCLTRSGILTLGALVDTSRRELGCIKNMGAKSMEDIEEKVRLCGYALKDTLRCDHLKKMQFLKKAHDHFFELTRSFNSTHFSPYSQDWVYPSVLSSSTGWEYVRKVVLMAYGVSDICSLPDDKEEEVNAFAIELTDMLFGRLSKQTTGYVR